ncbi:MAG: hypothetical protein RIQ94_2028 [Pseudomonadota bacterium]
MYFNGYGVTKNTVLAYMWEYIASDIGSDVALKNRDFYAQHLSDTQLVEAKKLAKVCTDSNYKNCGLTY